MKQLDSIKRKIPIDKLDLQSENLLRELFLKECLSDQMNQTGCEYDAGNLNEDTTFNICDSITMYMDFMVLLICCCGSIVRQYLQNRSYIAKECIPEACLGHENEIVIVLYRTEDGYRRKNMLNNGETNEINEILKLVRIAQDLSTKEVADRMNVRSSYISDVERGDRNPNLKTLDKYCAALNISTDNLFLWREDQKKNRYTYRKLLMKLLQAIDEIDERQKKETERLMQLKEEFNSKSIAN